MPTQQTRLESTQHRNEDAGNNSFASEGEYPRVIKEKHRIKLKAWIGILLACCTLLCAQSSPAQIIISEFMTANTGGAVDDTGAHSDWIELYNAGTESLVLDGWYLTDDPKWLTKWQFPQGLAPLQPNTYYVVWASGNNRLDPSSPLHTNFKLGREGGYLALLDSTATTISVFESYPPQYPDVSYGRDRVNSDLVGFFHYPTPAAQNINGLPSPSFSHATGIYTNASISLVLGSETGTIRYTTDGKLPTTNSLPYSGPITLATNVTVKARVFPADGSGELPSDVVARNFIFLDNATADFNSNLPLLIISTEGRHIPQDGISRTNGSLAIIDVKNARSSPGDRPNLQVLAAFEYYGQTAIGFAKKPIRVETQDAYGNDQRVSILGMPPGSDYRLRNPYNDKSFLNEFLSTELYEQMGRQSVRRRFVETFVDSGGGRLNYADYYGIMVVFEGIQIDHNRLHLKRIPGSATNEPTISGGYIFKKDKDSVGDLGWTTAGGNGFGGIPLKIHDPKPNDLRTIPYGSTLTSGGQAQFDYLKKYINQLERVLYSNTWLTATGTNHYSYYLDIDAFVDLHWMVEFAKYIDGYRISSYFYKDRDSKIFPASIWGWNLGFGNGNYLLAGQTNGWYYDQIGDVDHGWLRRLIEGNPNVGNGVGDPEFVQKIADRWSQLRTNILNGSRVLSRIDDLATYLSGAASRDLSKYGTLGIYIWPNPDGGSATAGSVGTIDGRDVDFVRPRIYYDSTTNSIIGQLKKYINGRFLWIDSQFAVPPIIHASSGLVSNNYSVTLSAKPNVQIYYTLDGSDPRGLGGSTNGILYTGPITINGNVQIVARARGVNTWKNTWSGQSRATLYTTIPSLRITEIMYHPVGTNSIPSSAENLEYIELKNIGAESLNLNHFSLSGGIQFQFPSVNLPAGQTALVVKNASAFQSRYGTIPEVAILGEFDGKLSDSGDHIVLQGSVGEPILDFIYYDKWYPTTDGLGFSLVIRDENAPTASWSQASSWRPSNELRGSPGQSEPASTAPSVLVNEVLANNPSGPDVIELYNAADSAQDIGGWFLSDDFRSPSKYVVPANTIVPAKGYYLFYGTNSFSLPANALPGFALGSEGDDVWLFSGNGTNLTGYAHGFTFGASPSSRTLGRHVVSTGAEHFVLEEANSLGATNAGLAVGPIVITEINANPPNIGANGSPYSNTRDEYIELHNITGVSAPLYDPAYPTNTWHLQGAVQFAFPQDAQIPPNGFALVVGFDPAADPTATAAFRERNSVPESTSLFGPWSGQLGDEGATLQLFQPDQPAANGSVLYFTAEQVHYSNQLPWPGGWNATGLTLQKINPAAYSDDPANWFALFRNPGATQAPSGTPPIITSQPQDQIAPTGKDLTLTVTASGTDPHFQWRKNGFDIPSATNSLLVLSNFQSSMVGRYNILVYNSAGAALGDEFSVSSRGGLRLLTNPAPRIVLTGETTNFPVAATGTGTIGYQWRRNGALIDATNVFGAQSATLVISNAQPFNEGLYTVTITDDYDSYTSEPVSFEIGYRPVFVLQPLSQEVVQGSSVTLSVAATGTTPMTFRWRKQTGAFVYTTLATYVGATNSFFTITNFQSTDATNYSVSLSNIMGFASGGPASGRSFDAALTLLIDTDHDGLPDSWENGRAGFSATDPADASRDDDGDGMSNLAEFTAGTDYLDAQSYLKVNIDPAGATISFLAISNRTYSILRADVLGLSFTQRLADFPAFATNSVRTIVDPTPGTNRFYRLVTPHHP